MALSVYSLVANQDGDVAGDVVAVVVAHGL